MAGEIGTTGPRPTTGKLPAPATPATPAAPGAPAAPAGPAAPAARDRNATGPITAGPQAQAVNLDDVALPAGALEAANEKAKGAKDTAADAVTLAQTAGKAGDVMEKAGKTLGAVGVVTALGTVAAAFTKTPLDLNSLLGALGELGTNLADAAGELSKFPGLTKALQVFGGIGGIISGIMQLKDEIASIKEGGANAANITGVLAGACSLVGGVAMAISPFFPPAAAVGGAIMLAGAALNVGKLAIENWDSIKAGAGKAADAVASGARAVGGAVSDAADAVGGAASRAWNWITG